MSNQRNDADEDSRSIPSRNSPSQNESEPDKSIGRREFLGFAGKTIVALAGVEIVAQTVAYGKINKSRCCWAVPPGKPNECDPTGANWCRGSSNPPWTNTCYGDGGIGNHCEGTAPVANKCEVTQNGGGNKCRGATTQHGANTCDFPPSPGMRIANSCLSPTGNICTINEDRPGNVCTGETGSNTCQTPDPQTGVANECSPIAGTSGNLCVAPPTSNICNPPATANHS